MASDGALGRQLPAQYPEHRHPNRFCSNRDKSHQQRPAHSHTSQPAAAVSGPESHGDLSRVGRNDSRESDSLRKHGQSHRRPERRPELEVQTHFLAVHFVWPTNHFNLYRSRAVDHIRFAVYSSLNRSGVFIKLPWCIEVLLDQC